MSRWTTALGATLVSLALVTGCSDGSSTDDGADSDVVTGNEDAGGDSVSLPDTAPDAGDEPDLGVSPDVGNEPDSPTGAAGLPPQLQIPHLGGAAVGTANGPSYQVRFVLGAEVTAEEGAGDTMTLNPRGNE